MRTGSRYTLLCLLMMPMMAVAAGKKEPPPMSASGCVENVDISGSFSSGKTFVASSDHEGVPYPVVFQKTVAMIEAEEYLNVSPNATTGYIAADNPVKGGGGSTVPLRVTVRRQNDGTVRVEARFSIKGGQMAPKKAVSEGLCKITDAASM